ncbi:protein transport protein Sec24A-like isoform X3 [Saccostrea echinata]|uniref:protein transport protein Sec24A-like isoform X3 n=1 Tax=Saccostrea echinata TaxID=191078 RepID=UPI002A803347|nr:protein transport protein Sec24A-like isoform X3 [Saccostrea echinata]
MADQHSHYNSSPNGPHNFNSYAQPTRTGPPGGMQNKNLAGQIMNRPPMSTSGNVLHTMPPAGYNASLNGHGTPPLSKPPMQRMQPPMGLPSNRFQPPMMNVSAPSQAFMNGPVNRPSNPNSIQKQSQAQNMPVSSISSSGSLPTGISSAPVPGMPYSSSASAVDSFNAVQTSSHSNSPVPLNFSAQPPGGLPDQRTDTPPTEGGLPVPFHGQGQYSHQVGMSLTPGLTPNNSEPTSRKSSRAPSPLETQSYEALEGGDLSTKTEKESFPGSGDDKQDQQIQSLPGVSNTFSQGNRNRGSPVTQVNPSTAIGGPPSTHRPSPAMGQGPPNPYQSKPGPQGPTMGQPGISHAGTPQRTGTPTSYSGQQPRQPGPPQTGYGQQGMGVPRSNVPPTGVQRPISAPRPPMSAQPNPYGSPSLGGPTPAVGGYMPPTSFSGQQPQGVMAPSSMQGSFPPTSYSGQQPPVGGPPSSVAGGMYNNQGPPSGPTGIPPMRAPMPPVPTSVPSPGMPPVSRPGPPTGGPPTTGGFLHQPGMSPVTSGAPPTSYGTTQPPPTGFPLQMQPGHIGSTPSRPKYPQMPTSPPTTWQPQSQNPPQFSQPGSYQPNVQPGVYSPGQQGSNQPGGGQGGIPPSAPGGFPTSSQPGNLSASFSSMSVQDRVVNLLNEKNLLPPEGLEVVKPRLNNEYKKVNCQADVFRCTLTAIPQTSNLLNKARLPLGILIHPFKDLSQLPVIQSSVIVRCRSCRTYINPFVFFVDSRRWKCNLCYRVNELPDEFSYDPVSKTYGEPQRRPEIKSSTIEFIAPSDYMLRPPQPALYLFLLDVSFNAVETGYLSIFCQLLLEEIDKLPRDSRTQIGFIAYDRALHFFNLAEGLSQPQMLTVSDIDDIFLPCPDNLLVNLNECKDLVLDLLNMMPSLFEGNLETGSALGAALQAAHKLVSPVGGRVTVMQTVLPTAGPGSLQSREDPSLRSGKNVTNLGPATDFYKKLALDCSAQQVAVDLFMLNGQYADIASISCISKYSGGCVYQYPSFHAVKNPSLTEKFEADLRRYLTRKIGFEAVMRIRCTKGLSIHTFHGNFFVRSTDLLSLPNVNPDAGFGMQMSIEDSLVDTNTVCFQAALLYTSSKGERRIRVHTLCLPVTNQLSEIYAGADQQAIVGLLAKMAVDRSVTSSLTDAREALINAAMDSLASFGSTIPPAQRIGSLPICYSLRMLPTFILALLKSKAFRVGLNTPLDERVFAMQQCKSLPVGQLLKTLSPDLYPVHSIEKYNTEKKGDILVPKPPLLHLSSANIDRTGVYVMDTLDTIYLYVGSAAPQIFIQEVLDAPNFMSIPEGLIDLPELDNERSELMRNFITDLLDNRPGGSCFYVIRDDGKRRMEFFERMVEDRSESSMSLYEFLQHLQKQIKS